MVLFTVAAAAGNQLVFLILQDQVLAIRLDQVDLVDQQITVEIKVMAPILYY